SPERQLRGRLRNRGACGLDPRRTDGSPGPLRCGHLLPRRHEQTYSRMMRNVVLALFVLAGNVFAQQPQIDSIKPPSGPIAGGTAITISGTNFTGAALKLDRNPVTPLSRTDSEIRLQMQPHANGYVVISIESSSGVAYGEFLYVPPR